MAVSGLRGLFSASERMALELAERLSQQAKERGLPNTICKMETDKILNFSITFIPNLYEDTQKAIANIVCCAITYRMKERGESLEEACDYFGISIKPDYFWEIVKRPPFDNLAKSRGGISHKTAFEFKDKRKTSREKLTLCAFQAIKSIVGAKPYARTTRRQILSRMSGSDKNTDDISSYVSNLSGARGRRRFDTLLDSLSLYGVETYSPQGCHGFYISTTLSIGELVERVERQISSYKGEHLTKSQKRVLGNEIRARLKRTP